MCAMVSSALPQAHVVSAVWNFHFCICALLQVYSVRRRLRHFHVCFFTNTVIYNSQEKRKKKRQELHIAKIIIINRQTEKYIYIYIGYIYIYI